MLEVAQIRAPHLGSDVFSISLNTVLAMIVFVIAVRIHDLGTPGKLVQEILEKGNVALGLYLGGALIGLGFVMQAILASPVDAEAGAIQFTNSVWIDGAINTLVWGLAAPIMQLFAMRLFDWITPGLDFRVALERDNRAVGITLGALNIAVGLVLSALFGG